MTDRYRTALSAAKIVGASQVFDLTPEEYEFVTGDDLWISVDRSRARRAVEALIYGALDYLGYPRFAVPVEFVACAIAYHVHPINFQTAALIMEGDCTTIDNIINGVEQPLKAAQIFAHVIYVHSADFSRVDGRNAQVERHLKAGALKPRKSSSLTKDAQ